METDRFLSLELKQRYSLSSLLNITFTFEYYFYDKFCVCDSGNGSEFESLNIHRFWMVEKVRSSKIEMVERMEKLESLNICKIQTFGKFESLNI